MTKRVMPNWRNCVTNQVLIYSSFVLLPRKTYWQMHCQTLHPIERFMPTLCSISKNHYQVLLHHRKPSQWVCCRRQNTPPSSSLCAMFFQIMPTTIQPTPCSTKLCVLKVMSSGLHLCSITTLVMFLCREPLRANLHRSLQFRVMEKQRKSLLTAPTQVRKGLVSTQTF